ncbi:MAG TPA: Spy/CpxP family protein refolding chaperone [Steroidobacteraceae bacterium]|nr:Spy/CpxP family protein refolding chaperone [Steroidobacteraceae bacterium]
MINLRRIVPSLCLATALSGLAVYTATADDTAPATGSGGAPQWHHGHCGHGGGPGQMGMVLHQLNLGADQKAQVKSIFASEKSQLEALRQSAKSNRQALATTPTTDPGYAALVETAQHNAATRITLEQQTWKQIYESVLTKEQQQQIPGIVAAAQAARESRMDNWKAQHPQPPAD